MTAPRSAVEQQLEQALLELATVRYDLTLFVSGASPLSARAITNAQALCEAHLPERYLLTVVDVRSDPAQVSATGVLAVPTLVRVAPLPRRIVVGDLSDIARVLATLDLPSLPAVEPAS
jgi:circadian clock protein KaiB